MLQIPAHTGPAALADALEGLAVQVQDDREAAAILQEARKALATLSWNRYAQATSQRSIARQRARHLRYRHQRQAPILLLADSTPEDLALTETIKRAIVAELVGAAHA